MSPFPARELHPREPSPVRLWGEPIVVGLVVQSLIAGVMLTLGTAGVFGPLLVLVVAGVFGWRYGFVRGLVGAGLPIMLLLGAELVRQAFSDDDASGPIQTVLIAVSVLLFMAGITFLMSAIRGRYRTPRPTGTDPDALR